MTAVVAAYAPPPDGEPLCAEDLAQALRAAGVADSLIPESNPLLLLARMGKDITGKVAARGTPPREPQDANVEFVGDTGLPIFHGQVFARLAPPVDPAPGITLTGQPLPPASQRRPESLTPGQDAGWALNESSGECRATRYGLAVLAEGRLTVEPLIRVTPDRMLATGDVHPRTMDGEEPTVDMFRRELYVMGLRTMAKNSIQRAIDKAAAAGTPVKGAVLAKGKPAQDGAPGRFKLLFKADEHGREGDDLDAVDPRERSIFTPIKAGTLIGRLLPPEPGSPGRDLYGKILAPRTGKPCAVIAGDNVEISEDGEEFKASADGMITWERQRVAVLDMVRVAGDVSYATGNLRLDTGSALVDGSVVEGFTVTAPGDVCVRGAVESAFIEAGGNVGVGGGLVMGNEGHVNAGGDVACSFAENAVLVAGGNVEAAQHISSSDIQAGGVVRCVKGKGIIMGGSVRAAGGVEANELGTEFGVRTLIVVDPGLQVDGVQEIVAERKTLRERKSKLDAALGTEQPQAILARTPEAKRAEVAKLLKVRLAVETRLAELAAALEERRETLEKIQAVRVRVRRMAHLGTEIRIAGGRMILHEPQEGPCEFFFDAEKERVALRK